jgi:hypothetical protein
MKRGGFPAITCQRYLATLLGCLVLMLSACRSGQPSTATAVPDSTPGGAASDTPPKTMPSPTDIVPSGSGGASSRLVASPTPVLQATLTDEPDKIPVVKFIRASSQTTTPEDVLKEIAIFDPGGGGGGGCDPFRPNDHPLIVTPDEYSRQSEQILDLGLSIWIITCGWKPQEVVTVTVIAPNGDSASQQEQEIGTAKYPNGVFYKLQTRPSDLVGKYTVAFEGASGRLEYSVTVKAPGSPRVYREENKLWPYGFLPNEPVRVLVYDWSNEKPYLYGFAGWQEFQVGPTGQLIVETDNAGTYFVLGTTSGYVEDSNVLAPDYLEATDSIEVLDGPGDKYKVIAKLTKGARLRVTGDPSPSSDWGKKDNWTMWWPISLDDGRRGWVSYGVKRIISQSREPVNSTCPGAAVSRIQIGMKTRVTFTDGVPVRVRSDPGTSGNKIKSIPEGTEMSVIDGPVCKDSFVWWHVKTDDGTVGWVAEGEPGNYFVEPWQ